MSRAKFWTQIMVMAAVGLAGIGWGSQAVGAEGPGLSAARFEQLHSELQSPREPWQAIPWKLSVLEAQRQAAEEKKPVYMLVRSGHPLGCV